MKHRLSAFCQVCLCELGSRHTVRIDQGMMKGKIIFDSAAVVVPFVVLLKYIPKRQFIIHPAFILVYKALPVQFTFLRPATYARQSSIRNAFNHCPLRCTVLRDFPHRHTRGSCPRQWARYTRYVPFSVWMRMTAHYWVNIDAGEMLMKRIPFIPRELIGQ